MFSLIGEWLKELAIDTDNSVKSVIQDEFSFLCWLAAAHIKLDYPFVFLEIIRLGIYILSLSYFTVLVFMTSIISMPDFVYFANMLAIFFVLIISLTILISLNFNRRKLNSFLRYVSCGFFKYEDTVKNQHVENLIITSRRQRLIILIAAPSSLASCIAVLFLVSPVVDHLTDPVDYLAELDLNRDLPAPLAIPYSTENPLVLYATAVHETISAAFLGLQISTGIVIYMFLVQQITIQLEILCISIENIDIRAEHYMELHYPAEYTEMKRSAHKNQCFMNCVKFCLKQNAKHHQVIIKAFQEVQTILDVPILVVNYSMMFLIAVTLSALTVPEGRYGSKLFSLAILFVEIGALAIIHYFGQKLIDYSWLLRERLYFISWYHYDSSIKSMITIMEERATRPLEYVAMGISPCNWETFSSIMNSAYSYLNVMVAAFTKN